MSGQPDDCLVLDTGPLSHFAKEGWLGALRMIIGHRRAVIPDVVVAELHAGRTRYPWLQQVLEADWIDQVELASEVEVQAFASFSSLMVVGDRNIGESGVLAYANVHGAIAVVDDGHARKAAADRGVKTQSTLRLLCDGIGQGLLTTKGVSVIVDHLIEGKYRLPFAAGEFEKWAIENGLLA